MIPGAGRLLPQTVYELDTEGKVVFQMLKKLGCRADTAANGMEVPEALEKKRYGLVLMDVSDARDGRARDCAPDSPGSSMNRAAEDHSPHRLRPGGLQGEMPEAGMDGYISKTVKMEDLKKALRGREGRSAERRDRRRKASEK